MSSLLWNFVDDLAKEIHRTKCKDCDCFHEYESVEDNLKNYKCLSVNKTYSNKFDEE